MPLVCVVMPVYNGQRFVKRAIQSVLEQTFADFEFVIVDDGSTDETPAILRECAARDERIRIISRPNTGIVGALNDGLAAATGKYLARIDADDWSAPGRFELQVQRLDSDPRLVAVGCGAVVVDPDGERLGEFPVPLEHEEIEAQHLAGESSIHHPAVMMRTQAVRQVGGYREGFCPAEDFDLWVRLGEVGRLANLADYLITKRLTEDGIVGSTLERQGQVIERILQDAWARRGLPGAPVVPARSLMRRADLYRQWAWLALKDGSPRVARKYAFRALQQQPCHPQSWRAVLCAIRGR